MSEASGTPLRRLWLMPWRWNRWLLYSLIILPAALYMLLGMPIHYALLRLNAPNSAQRMYDKAFEPYWICFRNGDPFAVFSLWQESVLSRYFGSNLPAAIWHGPLDNDIHYFPNPVPIEYVEEQQE